MKSKPQDNPRARLIDVSHHDRYFYADRVTAPLHGVIQRVGYGDNPDTIRDQAFKDGVSHYELRMAYHYVMDYTSWEAHFDLMSKWVDGKGFRAFCVDIEKYYNPNYGPKLFDIALRYAEELQKLGRKVLIYSNPYWFRDDLLPYSDEFGKYDKWIARYGGQDPDTGSPLWGNFDALNPWTFWQFTRTAKGTDHGVARPNSCDLNVFNGTPDDLAAYLEAPQPPPPVEGDWNSALDAGIEALEALKRPRKL